MLRVELEAPRPRNAMDSEVGGATASPVLRMRGQAGPHPARGARDRPTRVDRGDFTFAFFVTSEDNKHMVNRRAAHD